MTPDTDALTGGEALSMDEAISRYVASDTAPAVTDQAEDEDEQIDATTGDDTEATDEAAPDDEGDSAEDQADTEDDEEQPQSDMGRFVADNAKVRLEDGRIVSVADLKSGSLMHADYTRKTQEVAEQRRSVETELAAFKADKELLEQQRTIVRDLVQQIVPPMPDPSMLQADPMGYWQQRTAHEQWAARVQQLEQEQQRTQSERQAESDKQRMETANREMEALIAAVPELKNPEKLNAFAREIHDYGRTHGFTPEELTAVALDHRQAIILRKAIAYDKLQSAKPKMQAKVENRPPITKGGKRQSPDAQKAQSAQASLNRLKSSGRVDDAIQAYLAMKG